MLVMKTKCSKWIWLLSTFCGALYACAATQAMADQVTDIAMVPRLTIQGTPGATDQIQYRTNVNQGDWIVLTNVLVTTSNYWFVDVAAPPAPRRFYRVVITNQTPSGMALIPAGSFTMGNSMDPSEGSYDELPLHPVNVSAFYMDQNLVSSNLWATVKAWSAANGYSFGLGFAKASIHPVQTVDWYDAVKWCNARSQKEGLTPCYFTDAGFTQVYTTGQVTNPSVNWSANGYRLPTEAEGEKAARGGVSGHRFPWSNVDTITHSQANYYSSANFVYDISPTRGYHPTFNDGIFPYTSPVGYFGANGYGLYDMAGNLSEWLWDWYLDTYYSSSPGTDPRGPSTGAARVFRGGSWNNFADVSRCANRNSGVPTFSGLILGFRCVRGL